MSDKTEEFGQAPNEPHDEYGRAVCLQCGSKLGGDCGDAEPDFNAQFCSKGCFQKHSYPNVGLWDCMFYLLDDDGNELMDDEGKVIIFTAPHVDYAGVFDYITVHDLEEMSDMSETNELL